MKSHCLPLLLLAFAPLSLHAEENGRIVSAGGTITEIVCALGHREELVAVDSSSVYPADVTKLPQIGYARMLSTEGLISQRPTLVIASEDAGPPAVISELERLGIRLEKVPADHNIAGAEERIRRIGKLLNAEEDSSKLIESMRKEIENARKAISPNAERPKVLFIYARAGGTLNVAGRDTSAEAIIQLAGGENAMTGYEGYKPLTAEAALAAAPDIILLTTRGLADAGGLDALLKHPGLSHTTAAKNRRVVAMDDLLLLGFGPRLGEAIHELAAHFHPGETRAQLPTATSGGELR